jgi:hypothetical protein
MVRKGLPFSGDYYVNYDKGTLADLEFKEYNRHVNHCLDSLRQGIQCASDVR